MHPNVRRLFVCEFHQGVPLFYYLGGPFHGTALLPPSINSYLRGASLFALFSFIRLLRSRPFVQDLCERFLYHLCRRRGAVALPHAGVGGRDVLSYSLLPRTARFSLRAPCRATPRSHRRGPPPSRRRARNPRRSAVLLLQTLPPGTLHLSLRRLRRLPRSVAGQPVAPAELGKGYAAICT